MNKILQGDCIEELKKLEENSVDCIVTDPPYGLEFMGKEWDSFKEKGQSDGWQKAGKPSMKKFDGKKTFNCVCCERVEKSNCQKKPRA